MKKFLFALCVATMVSVTAPLPAIAGGGVEAGAAAPEFTLKDQAGHEVKLSDTAGKIRVLEWVNPDCPFVKRHYEAGTMNRLAKAYAGKGVVWMAINSTNYMDAAASAAFLEANSLSYPILIDSSGEVGHAYGARTTPHIFIIDGDGRVAYQGAIDDDPRGTKDKAENYVETVLNELLAGKAVSITETKPYGCSVKYK